MDRFSQHPEPANGGIIVRQPATPGARMVHADVPPQPYYAADGTEDSDSGGLLDYWRLLRRHKRMLFLFALGGTLLAILLGLPLTPSYKVHISLEVLNVNEDFMNMKGASPVTTNDYSFDTSEEETQAKLLQSDALVERVIQKLDPDYARLQRMQRPQATWWRSLLNIPEPLPLTDREKLLNKLADSLKVTATQRTRVIEATVKSTDPQLAVDFANTLGNEFIEQSIEARWKSTQKVGDWLTREINDARGKLERSEDTLQAYARTSGLIFTDDTTNIATEKLQQVQQQLSAATADRITRQATYELAKNAPPDSLPDVLNDEGLRDALTNINNLRGQIAQLSATFTPEYSKVKQAKAQLVALQAAFTHDRNSILERIADDYHQSISREKLLKATYDAQTREVTGQDEKAIQYNILKREVDSNRQLYDAMLQEMKQSSIASALHASNVRVVDPAEIPDKPFWPNFKILAFLGFFFGLCLGLTTVILRERTDRTLQQPGDAQLWTNLPELGTIPSASIDGEKDGRPRRLPGKANPALQGSGSSDDRATSVALITWERKPSLMAEAFRATLTSILFVGENGSRPRVLALTSASPSDGKTTAVSNLGIALAEIRHKVIIVDADLRRPRMHELFGLENERGLSDLLREQELSYEGVSALIQKTEVPGLDVLTSGPSTHAAANLLYSPNLAELLARFRKEYDMVLIDTPPMLQMTDARVIGRLSDGVILVTRAQQTTRDALIAASQRFMEDRIRILGTVLNDWNPKNSPNGYYGYYNTYRHYGYGDKTVKAEV